MRRCAPTAFQWTTKPGADPALAAELRVVAHLEAATAAAEEEPLLKPEWQPAVTQFLAACGVCLAEMFSGLLLTGKLACREWNDGELYDLMRRWVGHRMLGHRYAHYVAWCERGVPPWAAAGGGGGEDSPAFAAAVLLRANMCNLAHTTSDALAVYLSTSWRAFAAALEVGWEPPLRWVTPEQLRLSVLRWTEVDDGPAEPGVLLLRWWLWRLEVGGRGGYRRRRRRHRRRPGRDDEDDDDEEEEEDDEEEEEDEEEDEDDDANVEDVGPAHAGRAAARSLNRCLRDMWLPVRRVALLPDPEPLLMVSRAEAWPVLEEVLACADLCVTLHRAKQAGTVVTPGRRPQDVQVNLPAALYRVMQLQVHAVRLRPAVTDRAALAAKGAQALKRLLLRMSRAAATAGPGGLSLAALQSVLGAAVAPPLCDQELKGVLVAGLKRALAGVAAFGGLHLALRSEHQLALERVVGGWVGGPSSPPAATTFPVATWLAACFHGSSPGHVSLQHWSLANVVQQGWAAASGTAGARMAPTVSKWSACFFAGLEEPGAAPRRHVAQLAASVLVVDGAPLGTVACSANQGLPTVQSVCAMMLGPDGLAPLRRLQTAELCVAVVLLWHAAEGWRAAAALAVSIPAAPVPTGRTRKRGRRVGECVACSEEAAEVGCAEHPLCVGCAVRLLECRAGDEPTGREFECPHPGCTAGTVVWATKYLTARVRWELEGRAAAASSTARGGGVPCFNCWGLAKPGWAADCVATCGVFRLGTCVKCGLEAHRGALCGAAARETVETVLAEASLQRCPGCGAATLKEAAPGPGEESCNHMSCARCRTEWCWLCGEAFLGGEVDAHYQPPSTCAQFWEEGAAVRMRRRVLARTDLSEQLREQALQALTPLHV